MTVSNVPSASSYRYLRWSKNFNDFLFRIVRKNKSNLRRLLSITRFREWYWRVASSVHQGRRQLSLKHVDLPIDPYRLFLVDPERITRFTGRKFPVWTDRWEHFGVVMDGNWDNRNTSPIQSNHYGPDPSLYLAERFDEPCLYKGLVNCQSRTRLSHVTQ